jgi:GNAT superfamily N-acetyltransferase
MTGDVRLERLTGFDARTAETVDKTVQPLLDEYLQWCIRRLAHDLGVRFDHPDEVMEQHHDGFRAELPKLVSTRGRLVVARLGGRDGGADGDEAVGVGALKPVDETTAEIKRMYVRPDARGRGIGRALLERLLDDARAEGYDVARLETLSFMTDAHALYRSLGFHDAPMFDDSEAVEAGIESFTYYMEVKM